MIDDMTGCSLIHHEREQHLRRPASYVRLAKTDYDAAVELILLVVGEKR
jgi:hypothetical protein